MNGNFELSPTPTEHAEQKYLPQKKRSGIALCLSGGGFRAALFHLGALRRLNECGVLTQIDVVSSVSGGSIVAAHLATVLPQQSAGSVIANWNDLVANPMYRFMSRNLRTGPLLQRFLPWNWFRSSTAVEALARRYHRDLTELSLVGLPTHPRFVLSATDLAFGVNWTFERNRMGDYQAGYRTPSDDFPLSRAVAASSCFPPIFNPLPINVTPEELTGGRADTHPSYRDCVKGIKLTDGGNYDNLGLEPVWKDAEVVLVSDGGDTFDFEPDRDLFWRVSRYIDILGNQALAMRKRWLIASYIRGDITGAYWGIGGTTSSYGEEAPDGYGERLVDDVISEVRTDMDAFSTAEQQVLENHGYMMAEAAIRRHVSRLTVSSAQPYRVPHPEYCDEARVMKALRESKTRKLFGRW